MAGAPHHVKVFPARMSALPAVSAFTEHVGRTAGFDRAACLRLCLLVEELFTNTVCHGHGRDSDEPVRLAFDLEPGRIALTYEDTGPPHDPFAAVSAPDDRLSIEDRPVGGLGVPLVAGMAADVQYQRVEGQNRISLVVTAPD